MTALLEAQGVTVRAGEIVALLGSNGAGKTTWLETVLGFRPGPVRLFGEEVGALPVETRVARGIGYVPQGRRVFAGLTVRENLQAACALPAAARHRRVEEMLALFPMLGERPDARAWLLSGGQQQMLAEQRAAVALAVAGRGVVLRRGRVVREGPAAELAADPALADLMAGA